MTKNKLTLFIVALGLAAAYVSCKPEDPAPNTNTGNNNNNNNNNNNTSKCDTSAVTYDSSIKAIMTNYGCVGCHGGGSKNFGTYNGLKSWLTTGSNADQMIKSINHRNGALAMPSGGPKMDTCDINKVEAWIHQGLKQ